MKIAFHTLGCKLNFAESSHLLRQFTQAGHQAVDFHDVADLYVVNTCTVTSVAEKKCRNAIRQAVALNPHATVAVIGCFAQNAAAEIEKIPGVSLILGNDQKHRLFDIIQHPHLPAPPPLTEQPFPLAYSSGDRTRTFFKIQDGCDYFCTYCAIPFARGRSRSATIDETLAVARQIAQSGAKEVVLTGVNTGTFGLHTGESFLDLLRALDQLPGIERYRISSIEPNLLTDDIVRFVSESSHFAHHFHIPLQAGSDSVLALMHRKYTTDFYRSKVESIKQLMPDCCIAADLMVGFYGEGQREFDQALRFVESLPLSYLHVFTYSERPNTAALRLPGRVPMPERHRRCSLMLQLSDRKKHTFYQQHAGHQAVVLWESDLKQGFMHGFTDNYIRVRTRHDPSLVNTLQPVTLSTLNANEDAFDIA